MKLRKGFSLVELLLVVVIIAVLASIVVPRMTGAAAEAKNSKDDANWTNLVKALELYAADNDGEYPKNQADFDSNILNSAEYFPHGAPVCPHGGNYVYKRGTVIKHKAGK